MKKDFFDDDDFRSDSIDFDADDREEERFTGDDDDSFDLRPKKAKKRKKTAVTKRPVSAGNKNSKNASGILIGLTMAVVFLCAGSRILPGLIHSYRDLTDILASQNGPVAPTSRVATPTPGPGETEEESTLDPIYEADSRSSSRDDIAIDDEAFPDEAFRDYLLAVSDLNQDGFLDWSERSEVKALNVMHMEIQNLKGLEFFPNLEELYCSDNELTVLVPVRNFKLKVLFCEDNRLNYMDLTQNTQLEELHCNHNELSRLDVTQNKSLRYLFCRFNHLEALNVKQNTDLTEIDCRNNAVRTLEATDLTACRNILVDLAVVVKGENDGAVNVYRAMPSFGNLFRIDPDAPVLLSSVYFPDSNFLEIVKQYDSDGDGHLSKEECKSVKSLEIDSSVVCLDGVEFFPELQDLVLIDGSVSELDLSYNPKLQNLRAPGGILSKLVLPEQAELKILDVSNNLLPELDLSQNPAPEALLCAGNHLTDP